MPLFIYLCFHGSFLCIGEGWLLKAFSNLKVISSSHILKNSKRPTWTSLPQHKAHQQCLHWKILHMWNHLLYVECPFIIWEDFSHKEVFPNAKKTKGVSHWGIANTLNNILKQKKNYVNSNIFLKETRILLDVITL